MPLAPFVVLPALLTSGAGAPAATPSLQACAVSLAALSNDIARAASGAAAREESRAARQRFIDSILSEVDRLSSGDGGQPCEAAVAFVSTPDGELDESVTLEVAGNDGDSSIAFVSGTPMETIIQSINTVRRTTGVSASRALVNPFRVELRSVRPGIDQFVSVAQSDQSDRAPIIFATEHDDNGLYELTDTGANGPLGDVDCDLRVGFSDIVAVLRAWGACGGCPEDVDGDGVVGRLDVILVLERWDGS